MHTAAVVADDLTGTMDTAHMFAARAHHTAVLTHSGVQETKIDTNTSVVGINTGSRDADRWDAATTVTEAIETTSADVFYKKIDSTLRGNVSTEVDAALSATDYDLAVIAPAFPKGGRTTEQGIHYVEGTPVAETEYGTDEGGPTSSSIVDCFAATDRPLTTVNQTIVRNGRDTVISAFRTAIEGDDSDRAPVAVCDASTDGDLATIAAAAEEFDVLYVGSNGLAEHIAIHDEGGDSPAPFIRPDGAPLGVAGSINSTTLRQLDRVPTEAVFELDPIATLTGDGDDGTTTSVIERLRVGAPAVLTAATDREVADRTKTVGTENGLTPSEVRDRIAVNLGEAATHIVQEAEPSGLFLTGGDIAVAIMRTLGATTVQLTGKAIDTGIPIAQLTDGVAAGTPVITKAGGFGTEEAIVNCLDTLSSNDD